MFPRIHSLLASMGVLAIIMGILFLLSASPEDQTTSVPTLQPSPTNTSTQTASMGVEIEMPTPPASTTEKATTPTSTEVKKTDTTDKKSASTAKPETNPPPGNEVVRIQNPYPFPPQLVPVLNDIARASLVNILCTQLARGVSTSVSGSGVIIDPRGVILTNAHVAQYVLLSQDPRTNISCVIRTGAPATPRWTAETLFIPRAWVEAHAEEITMAHPLGTGEHDYALLLIKKSLDGSPLPILPFLPVDVREAIGFKDDEVLVASYPTEFVGDAVAQFSLYPLTSITTIKQFLTFVSDSVDLLSLGGVAGAQGGSSGGAVVNAWGFLIGLISTTSEGETTAMRDLRAISLSYIDRDITVQTQSDLATILGDDVLSKALDFNTRVAPDLINLYLK